MIILEPSGIFKLIFNYLTIENQNRLFYPFFLIINILRIQSSGEIIETKIHSLQYDYFGNLQNNLKPYYEFSKRNSSFGKKISEKRLKKQLKDTREDLNKNLDNFPIDLDAKKLKKRIIQGLNIKFLLRGFDKRRLIVINIREKKQKYFSEKELLFIDEHIGLFDVLFLIPKEKSPPYPVVVILLGHGYLNTMFKQEHTVIELVKNGFLVVIPQFRAIWFDKDKEYKISKNLLLNGFTLMGIRVYETLLVLKYLKHLKEVDDTKIGLMGHSAGSIIAALVARISNEIRALVKDYEINFAYSTFENVHCENIPALVYYHRAINNVDSLNMPVLEVSYYFQDQKKIINFFIKNFKTL